MRFWERYGNKIRMGRRGVWEFKGYGCLPRSDDGEEEVRLVEVEGVVEALGGGRMKEVKKGHKGHQLLRISWGVAT